MDFTSFFAGQTSLSMEGSYYNVKPNRLRKPLLMVSYAALPGKGP